MARSLSVPPEVPRYFADKSLRLAFSWLDVWGEQHAYAFTLAKATDVELLGTIKASIQRSRAVKASRPGAGICGQSWSASAERSRAALPTRSAASLEAGWLTPTGAIGETANALVGVNLVLREHAVAYAGRVLRATGATPAQVRVGVLLAMGRRKPDIARELGVKLSSVEDSPGSSMPGWTSTTPPSSGHCSG